MKIASANLQMSASHASLQHQEVRETLRIRHVRPEPTPAPPARPNVELSDAGKSAAESSTDASTNDPRLLLLRIMFEAMTGQPMKVFNPGDMENRPTAPPASAIAASVPAGTSIEYERHSSYSEAEMTRFSASGTVNTADGRQISFTLNLEMARSYHEESSTLLQLGSAAKKTDPLVINYSGTAASLTDQRFAFDLNADGTPEQIAGLGAGSGYLAFDRNGNGTIDNGSELFGPQSGDGFADLAQLDDDANGWIDENDAAFNQLSLWSGNGQSGQSLPSLAQAGIGAIALQRLNTPFDLKTNANELLGQIRNSGIFLHEDGTAGTIQQIDLTA